MEPDPVPFEVEPFNAGRIFAEPLERLAGTALLAVVERLERSAAIDRFERVFRIR